MRVRDTAARRARMVEYCERLRSELIDGGLYPAQLVDLRAGELSELVIAARSRARHNHPSRGGEPWQQRRAPRR